MASNSNFNSINDKNLEQCVVTFLEKVDSMEKAKCQLSKKSLPPAQAELRTLQLWRSVISECLATFLYIFIVCGATSTSASAGSFPQTTNVTAAASGFTICVLTYCFQNLSGEFKSNETRVSLIPQMDPRVVLQSWNFSLEKISKIRGVNEIFKN